MGILGEAMSEYFTEKTSRQRALPRDSNLINYSILNEFYSPAPFRSFSIKYVVQGSELYSVNGNKHIVKSQQYLLANKFSEGYVEIDSKKAVKGICIDVSPAILSEVVASFLQPGTPYSDLRLDTFFNTPLFFENKYDAKTTQLGEILREIEIRKERDPDYELSFGKDFYYLISEKIVSDHIPIFKEFQNIKTVKTITKKDLYKKLLKTREFMNGAYLNPIRTEQLSFLAGLSEYHFYRLFKTTFGVSPHQYLLSKRLEHAYTLLVRERPTIGEVAYICAFSDIYSFSKAFKRRYGFAPSALTAKK